MRDIDEVFAVLRRSRFRSRFRLSAKEAEYLEQKGLATVLEHARNFITTRLAAANPLNDGRQTPMKNHPVFVAPARHSHLLPKMPRKMASHPAK